VLACGQSFSSLTVVIVMAIRLVFGGRNDRALVGIDLDIEDLGSAENLYLVDPTVLIRLSHPKFAHKAFFG
jgi:hypothetical protein